MDVINNLWNDLLAKASARTILLNMQRDVELLNSHNWMINVDTDGRMYLNDENGKYTDILEYDVPRFEFENTIWPEDSDIAFNETDVSDYAMFFECMNAAVGDTVDGIIIRCFGSYGNVLLLEMGGTIPYVQFCYCKQQKKLVYNRNHNQWIDKFMKLLRHYV